MVVDLQAIMGESAVALARATYLDIGTRPGSPSRPDGPQVSFEAHNAAYSPGVRPVCALNSRMKCAWSK